MQIYSVKKIFKKTIDILFKYIYNMCIYKNRKREKSVKKEILAVCDEDEGYVKRFMEYLTEKNDMPFELIAFTKKEELLCYLEENKVYILLIAAEIMTETLKEKNIKTILLLSSGDIKMELEEYKSVYKYQSIEKIMRTLLEYFVSTQEKAIAVAKRENEIIGVYSPVGRTGKTTFAFTLGQVFATDFQTLYINMEEFSAFSKIMKEDYPGDLSDLMYFYRQNPDVLPVKLQAVVQHIHGMDYVPPMIFSEDLRNVSIEQWLGFLATIKNFTSYEKIILDLGNMLGNIFQVLEICSRIYMPICKDHLSQMKISAFEEYLLKRGWEDILNKTEKVDVPYQESFENEDNYFEQKLWGEVGDYVRKVSAGFC